MNICLDGHDEIVFDGYSCPFCDYISGKEGEIKSLEKDIRDLQDKIDGLEDLEMRGK